MKQSVILSIKGKQNYEDQDPEILELVTEGTLEEYPNGWKVSYEESELTGMSGVTTSFRVQPEVITLSRRGKLNSQMVFREGKKYESLYQLEFGALMITVRAQRVDYQLSNEGGYIDLVYGIEIEQSATGTIEYHLDITPKKA